MRRSSSTSRSAPSASSGISILLEEAHRAGIDGFELIVIKAPPDVHRMFDLAGLQDKLTFRAAPR